LLRCDLRRYDSDALLQVPCSFRSHVSLPEATFSYTPSSSRQIVALANRCQGRPGVPQLDFEFTDPESLEAVVAQLPPVVVSVVIVAVPNMPAGGVHVAIESKVASLGKSPRC